MVSTRWTWPVWVGWLVACTAEQTIQVSADDFEGYDFAIVFAVDEQGNPVSDGRTLDLSGPASFAEDLDLSAAGYVIAGIRFEDLSLLARERVDRADPQPELGSATLGPGAAVPPDERLDPPRLELALRSGSPHVRVDGPHAFSGDETLGRGFESSRVLRVRLRDEFCSSERELVPLYEPSLSDGLPVAGVVDTAELDGERLVVLSSEVLVLEPGERPTRDSMIRLPFEPSATVKRATSIAIDPREDPSGIKRAYVSAYQVTPAGSEGLLFELIIPLVDFARTSTVIVHRFAQSERLSAVAVDGEGNQIVVGKSNTLDPGYFAFRAGTSSASFEPREVTLAGRDNGLSMDKVAIAPGRRAGAWLVAITSSLGGIDVLEHEGGRFEHRERFELPVVLLRTIHYYALRLVETERGLELWAVGSSGVLLRRKGDLRAGPCADCWSLVGDEIFRRANEILSPALGECTTFGTDAKVDPLDVILLDDSAYLLLDGCNGVITLRLDEMGELFCLGAAFRRGVSPPGRLVIQGASGDRVRLGRWQDRLVTGHRTQLDLESLQDL